MNERLRRLSWVFALAAVPTYATAFWLLGGVFLRAALSEGVGYNTERVEWYLSRALSIATALFLITSIVLGVRAVGTSIGKAWWCLPALGALVLLIWWDFVGVGFR